MPILRIIHETSESYRLFSESTLCSPSSSDSDTMSDGKQEPIESDLTPDEANRIIHSHRKVRYGTSTFRASRKRFAVLTSRKLRLNIGTACWPCRQRKVKCDNKQPCENCEKRDHASLCSYNPKQHATKKAGSISGLKRPRSPGSEDSSAKREDDRWPRTTGMS
jgi:hypothetical protein